MINEGVNTIKDSIETLGNKMSLDNYAILIDLLCNCFEFLSKEEGLQTIIFQTITKCFNLIFIKETTNKMNDKLLTSINDDSTEWENLIDYPMAGLNLIENLIKNWSFEIYILLDRDGINAFIDRCKRKFFEDEEDEIDGEIKIMANNISNQIFNYKASLRKFFVMNGYPKKLT